MFYANWDEVRNVIQSQIDICNGNHDDESFAERCMNEGARRVLVKILDEVTVGVTLMDEWAVWGDIINYLFNKEREAKDMPYSDKRQERIATIREIIRYVEGIDPRTIGGCADGKSD